MDLNPDNYVLLSAPLIGGTVVILGVTEWEGTGGLRRCGLVIFICYYLSCFMLSLPGVEVELAKWQIGTASSATLAVLLATLM